MKRSTWVIMIFALFLVGSTALVGQTSAAEKIYFEAFDTFDPFHGVGNILNPGTLTCPGGYPLPPPSGPPYNPDDFLVSPCSEGSRVHTRGYTILTRFDATMDDSEDLDLVSGFATITINANFDADGNGPAWGTISIAPDLDKEGTWDGRWEGIRVKKGDLWVIPVHASLRGTGGLVEGMHYKAVDKIETPYFVVVGYDGEIVGRIIDPHSK